MEGDPKFDGVAGPARLPVRALRASCSGSRASASTTPTSVGAAWDEALAADRPCVIEAITDPEVPPLPPHITLEQAKMFMSALRQRRPGRAADDPARASSRSSPSSCPGR